MTTHCFTVFKFLILSLGKKTKSRGVVTGELSTVVGAEVTVTPFGNVRWVSKIPFYFSFFASYPSINRKGA